MVVLEKMSNEDFMLYMAYVIDKFDDFKNMIYASDIPWSIKGKAPCNIDNLAIYAQAIKRGKPEIYTKNKSLRKMFDEVEKYLWGNVRPSADKLGGL